MLKKLHEILIDDKVRVWHLIVGGIFMLFITTGINYWISSSSSYGALITERSRDLVVSSADFENRLHSLLMSGDSFAGLDREQYKKLNENIETQISALNKLSPVLKDNQRKIVEEYQQVLVNLRDDLSSGLTPENTRRFGTNAILLTVKRQALLSALS